MKPFPTDPMQQHDLFIAALCADWRAAGTVTRVTPRADAVLEISKQHPRDGEFANNGSPTNQ